MYSAENNLLSIILKKMILWLILNLKRISFCHRFPLTITIREFPWNSWNVFEKRIVRIPWNAGREVTSTTPGRILKDRNRNVHESIPAAVRRRTRRWLPRRVPWNKNRTPGQKPTTTVSRATHPGSGRRVCVWRNYIRDAERYIGAKRDLENRRSESRFSDETRDPLLCLYSSLLL